MVELQDRRPGNLMAPMSHLLVVASCLILISCGDRTPAFNPRPLELLVPTSSLGQVAELDTWHVSGLTRGDRAPRMALSQQAGVPAVRIVPGDKRLTAIRRVRTALPVTPYLSWSWNVAPTSDGSHPLAILVGFSNNAVRAKAKGAQYQSSVRARMFPHDRLLMVTWDQHALRRGTLEHAPDLGPNAIRYTSRGGAENGGNWWVETLDLSALYQRAWPTDVVAGTMVVFLGITVASGPPKALAHVAGITVSR